MLNLDLDTHGSSPDSQRSPPYAPVGWRGASLPIPMIGLTKKLMPNHFACSIGPAARSRLVTTEPNRKNILIKINH
jgi:hypothetical protein